MVHQAAPTRHTQLEPIGSARHVGPRYPEGVRARATSLAVFLAGCQSPTQVTVGITTDVPCGSGAEQLATVGIAVGAPGGLDALDDATETSQCSGATIGDIVLVPGQGDEDRFGLRVVGAVGVDVQRCITEGFEPKDVPPGSGCIVARRALSFLPHTELELPIVLERSCIGKLCDAGSTCYKGGCVTAEIDPHDCTDKPCTPPNPVGSGGGGGAGGGDGGGGAAPVPPVLWAKRWGSAGPSAVTSIFAKVQGLALAGWYQGSMATQAPDQLPPAIGGVSNGFVLEIDPATGDATSASGVTSTVGSARVDAAASSGAYVGYAGLGAGTITVPPPFGSYGINTGSLWHAFALTQSSIAGDSETGGTLHRIDGLVVNSTDAFALAYTDGAFTLGPTYDAAGAALGRAFVSHTHPGNFWAQWLPAGGPGGANPPAFGLTAVEQSEVLIVGANAHDAGPFDVGPKVGMSNGEDIVLAGFGALMGDLRWHIEVGDAATQVVRSVAADATGRFVAGGDNAGILSFTGQALVAGPSTSGWVAVFQAELADATLVWGKSLTGSSGVRVWAVALDPTGNVVVAGTFGGALDLGTGPLTAPAGTRSVFLATFDPAGNILVARSFGGPAHLACDSGNAAPETRCYRLLVDASGQYLVGMFSGAIDLDGKGALPAPMGQGGFFLIKAPPP